MKPDYIKMLEVGKYFLAWRINVQTDVKTGLFIGRSIDKSYKLVFNWSFIK